MLRFYLWSLIYLPIASSLWGQSLHSLSFPFRIDGQELEMPLAGGLNAPQFSEADVNADGLLDLYVFDRVGNKHLVFIRVLAQDGAYPYRFEPAFSRFFPATSDWVMLRDYNDDGAADLFTAWVNAEEDISGIQVYPGYYHEDTLRFGEPLFSEMGIPYEGEGVAWSSIFVDPASYPIIGDMDCDGDLDILAFDLDGGHLKMYANQSVEQGWGRDSLLFSLGEACWGSFYENGFSVAVDLSPDSSSCASAGQGGLQAGRHGSLTLLDIDLEGDGDMDVVLGYSVFQALNRLYNGGSCELPWVNEQVYTNFLDPAHKATLPILPTAFRIDTNGDGLKDVVVAPGSRLAADDRQAVAWRYEQEDTGTAPVYSFQQDDFLVGEMIDLGTGACPAFADVNGDGLLDLVVGNTSLDKDYDTYAPRLFLFINVGTATSPAFELADDDWLGMSQFAAEANSFAPAFGDLDGDGDEDLLVGEWLGRLFYAENTAGPDQAMTFAPVIYNYQSIHVGQFSTPQIIDLNEDGLPDLLIGERNGNLNFFPNQGSSEEALFVASPEALPNNPFFGGVDTRMPGFSSGYSAPWAFQLADGRLQLLTGSETGNLEHYEPIGNDFMGDFQLLNPHLSGMSNGSRTRPFLVDIDADGYLELWVGNQSGGLSAFQTDFLASPPSSVAHRQAVTAPLLSIFPNPVESAVWLVLSNTAVETAQVSLYTTTGQLLQEETTTKKHFSLSLGHLPPGLYLLRVQLERTTFVSRLWRM